MGNVSSLSARKKANPLRWKCDERGCFNKLKRPKIEIFAECFPGNICMGDVDGLVEINGRFLFLEWKESKPLPMGQQILYERLTQDPRFIVIVAIGNPETMMLKEIGVFKAGILQSWGECGMDTLKARLKRWADRAKKGLTP